jgi:TRAP-type C4-dicarboxylate transport system substrate-binding protein
LVPQVGQTGVRPQSRLEKSVIKTLTRWALLVLALPSSAMAADPVKLKLAYFSSDQEPPYVSVMKPFADAVNKEAKGILEIHLHPGGVLGRSYGDQAKLVLDGTADMAWVNPSLTPQLFADGAVMQLPGLFSDLKEATLAHTGIMGAATLRGYEKFFALGSFANYPLMIHTRSPIASLADLRGRKIRANSAIEVITLQALGIESVVLPINEIALAIGKGTIDGTTMPPGSLFAYGISRMTKYHYVGHFGAAPLNFLMNREKFESLPIAGQDVIRRHSGAWTAARFVQGYDANNDAAMARLKAESPRTMIYPSRLDLDTADAAFKTVVAGWVAERPRHAELLKLLETEVAKLRATTGQGSP